MSRSKAPWRWRRPPARRARCADASPAAWSHARRAATFAAACTMGTPPGQRAHSWPPPGPGRMAEGAVDPRRGPSNLHQRARRPARPSRRGPLEDEAGPAPRQLAARRRTLSPRLHYGTAAAEAQRLTERLRLAPEGAADGILAPPLEPRSVAPPPRQLCLGKLRDAPGGGRCEGDEDEARARREMMITASEAQPRWAEMRGREVRDRTSARAPPRAPRAAPASRARAAGALAPRA